MKTLGIIGSGDLGQQIAYYALQDKHYSEVVFFDDFATTDTTTNGKILGKTPDVAAAFKNGLFDELIIGIGYKYLHVRKQLYDDFAGTIPFGRVIHSSAWIDVSAQVAKGCVIYPRCIIDAKAVIAANTILNIGCTIAHDTTIDKHCFLSPRVAIAGFTKVHEQCVLGINSTIVDNIEIVSKTQIGGGQLLSNQYLQADCTLAIRLNL